MSLRSSLHILLHLLIPFLVAWGFHQKQWFRPFLWMMLGMIIDLDHLFANPIYDPNRCSIEAHFMHQWFWWPGYAGLTIPKSTRWLGIGLCIHILLDITDCWWMRNIG